MFDNRQLRESRRAQIAHALASRNHAEQNFSIVLEDRPMALLVADRPQISAHLDDMHVGDITGGRSADPIPARGGPCASVS